ncbi:MAG: Ku protein [Alphaproteobacteria bacterium]|nr:Ku protein [Alphaproteobacteria bacterium]
MAAAARPYWTGFLKLSLVTIGVRLYTASTEREKVRFHMIHEPTGERVKQQLTVPGVGPVERDEIVKGYEYQKGHYITVDPDDIKRLRLETTDTIDIVEFVDDVDPIFFDSPYYLTPDGSVAEEGYRVIRESLRDTGKIAIGQVVINGQERIIAIRPMGTGLLGNALRYHDEVRKPEDYFSTISAEGADEDQLAIMEQIIKRKTKTFDAADFTDRYQTALRELIAEKMDGKLPAQEPERKPAQVINLMDALKRSLAAEDTEETPASRRTRAAANEGEAVEEKPAAKSAPRGRKAATGNQRSLLLPVEGGKAKTPRTTAKPTPAKSPAKPAAHEDEAPKRRRKAS